MQQKVEEALPKYSEIRTLLDREAERSTNAAVNSFKRKVIFTTLFGLGALVAVNLLCRSAHLNNHYRYQHDKDGYKGVQDYFQRVKDAFNALTMDLPVSQDSAQGSASVPPVRGLEEYKKDTKDSLKHRDAKNLKEANKIYLQHNDHEKAEYGTEETEEDDPQPPLEIVEDQAALEKRHKHEDDESESKEDAEYVELLKREDASDPEELEELKKV